MTIPFIGTKRDAKFGMIPFCSDSFLCVFSNLILYRGDVAANAADIDGYYAYGAYDKNG